MAVPAEEIREQATWVHRQDNASTHTLNLTRFWHTEHFIRTLPCFSTVVCSPVRELQYWTTVPDEGILT